MGLDLRLPIGAMFTIVGLLLAVYGLITGSDTAMYERSLSVNINLWWGGIMFAFGLMMLLLGRRGAATREAQGVSPTADSVEGRATEAREHRLELEKERSGKD